jgi:hypothetical protein
MFHREPRCTTKRVRQGAKRREGWFPFQVLQRRMARFVVQPEGLGPFLPAAALVVVHLE